MHSKCSVEVRREEKTKERDKVGDKSTYFHDVHTSKFREKCFYLKKKHDNKHTAQSGTVQSGTKFSKS